MNCNCITDLEKKIAERMKPQAGESATAECTGTALFILEGGYEYGLNIHFRVKGDRPGFKSAKGKEMSVKANYCPFCGKSVEKEQGA